MSDSKYKDLLKRSFSIIPQPFIEKAEKGEPLADKDLELLQSKKLSLDENVVIGSYVPEQFMSYFTFDNGSETEFLCQRLSIDEGTPFLSKQQVEELENERVDASSLPVDGFLEDDVLRFNFEEHDWELANEHRGQGFTNDYYCYNENDQFLSDLLDEIEKRAAGPAPSAPEAPSND